MTKPTVVFKSNCALKTVPHSAVESAEKLCDFALSMKQSEHIESIGQLADRLKQSKKLSGSIVVYYLPVSDGEDAIKAIEEFENREMIALNLLRGEAERVLAVTDEKVAKACRLQPNIFYAYFKPSCLNGHEALAGGDLDIEYLQAAEGICRDELTPKRDFISSAEFMEEIGQSQGVFTERLVLDSYDSAFNRTINTEFIMNPDFEARFLSPDAGMPQCFVYVPDQYMSAHMSVIKDAIKDYTGTFEFVFT